MKEKTNIMSSPEEIKGLIKRARAAQLTCDNLALTRAQQLCDLLVETANALEDLQWRFELSQKEKSDE